MQSQTNINSGAFNFKASTETKPMYNFAGASNLFKGFGQSSSTPLTIQTNWPTQSKNWFNTFQPTSQPFASQPSQAASQPSQAASQPSQAASQPFASQPSQAASQPSQAASQPFASQPFASQPSQAASQPSQAASQPLSPQLKKWSLSDLSEAKQAFIKPRLQELFNLKNNLNQKHHQFRVARACIHKQGLSDDLTQDLQDFKYIFQLVLCENPCEIIATRVEDLSKRNLYTVYLKLVKALLMDKCETKADLIKYLDEKITLTGDKRFLVTFRLLNEHNISKLSQDLYDEMTGFLVAVILLLNFEGYPHMTLQAGQTCCYYPKKVTRILTDLVAACYGPFLSAVCHNDLEIEAWIKGM